MHTLQYIHEHQMFNGSNSEEELIIDLAHKLSRLPRVSEKDQRNIHYFFAAQHVMGKPADEVLETFTVWKEFWDNEGYQEGDCIRICKGFMPFEKLNCCGWEVVGSEHDMEDEARIAVSLYERVQSHMRFQRGKEGTMDFSLHRVTILPPRDMPVWSGYEI